MTEWLEDWQSITHGDIRIKYSYVRETHVWSAGPVKLTLEPILTPPAIRWGDLYVLIEVLLTFLGRYRAFPECHMEIFGILPQDRRVSFDLASAELEIVE